MPNDDAVGKGGWGVENVSKSDYVILGCSLTEACTTLRPIGPPLLDKNHDNSELGSKITH